MKSLQPLVLMAQPRRHPRRLRCRGRLVESNAINSSAGIWTPGRNNTLGRWRFNRPVDVPVDLSWAKTASKWLHLTSLMGRVVRVDGQPVAEVDKQEQGQPQFRMRTRNGQS